MTADFILDTPIPDSLPGEPDRALPSAPAMAPYLLLRTAAIGLLAIVTLPLWPLFGVGVLIWGYPPNVVRGRDVWRYVGHALTVRPGEPPIPARVRAWVLLSIVYRATVVPVWGLAWHLDELLYGRALDAVEVEAPLIKISAARSGSTQLSHYLEEDPRLVAPSVIRCLFPYRWLWTLAGATLARVIDDERAIRILEKRVPPEFLERHEAHPYRTDTFEAPFYLQHLNALAIFLGPSVMADEFAVGRASRANAHLWNHDFVEQFDRVARKTLLHAGPGPDGRPPRFFAKGHFLAAADALEARYPDARFVTVVREPSKRLRSMINFLWVNPVDNVLRSPPWTTLGPALARTETDYNQVEMAWFTREGGARRHVVRFTDYVRDLEGTMSDLYRVCLDAEVLPPHVPRTHAPRKRTGYSVDRALADMGVDPDAFAARNADFARWCRGA